MPNMHLFCLPFFSFFIFFFHAVLSRCLPLITYLWDSFSPGAWLAPIFPSSSLPKQDRFLLHYFFVLCGICNTLPALYHLWIPFLLVVFSLSLQHLGWRSPLCCCCCNWTWYLKGGEKVGINCSDDSSPGLRDLLLWYQSLDQSSAMLSLFVWGDLIPGTFELVESQIPESVTGEGAHCILLPVLDMSESVRFDAPGPISPLRQALSALIATEKPLTFFHLPKSITCSLCILYPCRGVPT